MTTIERRAIDVDSLEREAEKLGYKIIPVKKKKPVDKL